MKPLVKSFIQNNIVLVEEGSYDELYDAAYDQLPDDYVRELTTILSSTLDIDFEKYAKRNIIKQFEYSLKDFLTDRSRGIEVYLPSFVGLCMNHINGLDWEVFQALIEQYLDNDPRVKLEHDGIDLFIVRRSKWLNL